MHEFRQRQGFLKFVGQALREIEIPNSGGLADGSAACASQSYQLRGMSADDRHGVAGLKDNIGVLLMQPALNTLSL
jgi:hypothetical protein